MLKYVARRCVRLGCHTFSNHCNSNHMQILKYPSRRSNRAELGLAIEMWVRDADRGLRIDAAEHDPAVIDLRDQHTQSDLHLAISETNHFEGVTIIDPVGRHRPMDFAVETSTEPVIGVQVPIAAGMASRDHLDSEGRVELIHLVQRATTMMPRCPCLEDTQEKFQMSRS